MRNGKAAAISDIEIFYSGLAPDSVTAVRLLSFAQFTDCLAHTQPCYEDKRGAFTYCRRLRAEVVNTSADASQTQLGTSIRHRRLPPKAIWNNGIWRTSCAPPDGKCQRVHDSSNLSTIPGLADLKAE